MPMKAIANFIDLVSELDTLQAFAAVAIEYNYVKPEMHLMDADGLGAESFLLVNI